MSFQVKWQRDAVDIPGATGYSYTVQPADQGKRLTFVVTAGNPSGSTVARSLAVLVPAAGPSLSISGTPSPTGLVGQAYSFTPTVAGGTAPYAFSIPTGSLPSGLTLNTTTGTISGTPTAAQTKTGIVVRVTDHVGAIADLPAFSITVAASGTPVTPATLFAAVQAAAPGAILSMQPGDYTNIDWSNINKAAPGITIHGQAGVTLAYIAVDTCSGLTFKAIPFTGLRSGNYGLYAVNSDRITFDGCSTTGNNPGGVHAGVGVFCRDSSNLSIVNNVISQIGDGIDGLDCTNVLVSGNHVSKISANFCFWSSVHTATFDKNYFANLDFLDPGAHPDAVQIASTGSTGRSNAVTIRYNNFDALTGDTTCQGIAFCENVDGLTINSNCAFGASDNGISVSGCTHVAITNNYEQAWVLNPRIYCRDGCDTVNMTGNFSNIAPFSLATTPPNTNVTIGPNTLIPEATSGSDTTRRNAFLASNPPIPVS